LAPLNDKHNAVSVAIWPWRTRPQAEAAASPSSCRRRVLIQAAVMAGVAGVLSFRFHHAAVVVLLLMALLIFTSQTATPFIYTLF
jgi:hypothetical protein